MARRGKHSTALFEVIQTSRREQKPLMLTARPPAARAAPSGGSVWAPKWLFARREAGPAGVPAAPTPPATAPAARAPALDPTDPTANVTAASLLAPREPVAATAPAPSPVEMAPASPAEACASEPVALPPEVSTTPPRQVSGKRLGLAVDHDRQEVTLKMRYTSALVTGFAVLVVVGLAYVIGRRMSDGPQKAKAHEALTSSAQIKQGPVTASALSVGRPARTNGQSRAGDPFAGAPGSGAAAPRTPEAPVYLDAPIVDGVARRTTNMNYLMIISYPPEKQRSAYEVSNFLTVNGITTTVEKGTARTNPGWFCVIGTRGFPPKFGRSPEYESYLKAIEAAAKRFPAKSKFDRVQPMAFKWTD